MKKTVKVVTNASLGLFVALGLVAVSQTARANNLLGIDVSHYQGSINWGSVAGCGPKYAFCKATEGVTYVDPTYAANMNNGKAAGLQMSGYDFAHPASNC